jgi:hypothetical protein
LILQQPAPPVPGFFHRPEIPHNKDTPADRPCDCEVNHLGWGAGRAVTLTV